jgi:Protein of unknown function (DUF3710)
VPLFRRKKDQAEDALGAAEVDAGGSDALDLSVDLGDLSEPDAEPDLVDVTEADPTDVVEAAQLAGSIGPYDAEDAPDDQLPRLDLGGLRVPGFPGMELRLELDRTTERVIAATAVTGDGQLQLQGFAAPRNGGLWDEVRAEIVAGILSAGGTVTEVVGPFGHELVAEVPSDDASAGLQPARFLGADGRRWFLRGVLSGSAARPGAASDLLEQVYSGTHVVRGDQAMAPRDLLPLRMPDDASAGEPAVEGAPRLDAFQRRGPEITEIH